jgi:hypothetical protein
MSDKYLRLHIDNIQQIVNLLEDQVPNIPFHTLCVLAAETYLGRKYDFTPGKMRMRIMGEQVKTKCNYPEQMSLKKLATRLAPGMHRPFCVSYGMGVDSTALLVHLARMYDHGKRPEYRPDIITFADTGNEKVETYRYLSVINAFLRANGLPEVVVLRYEPGRTKIGHYYTLEQNCLMNRTLPSLAFGFKRCSLKWKRGPQDKYRLGQAIVQRCLEKGLSTIVAIGYDAGPKDSCRSWDITDDQWFHYLYPLIELGWDRERCLAEIRQEGLPGYETDMGGKWLEKGGVPVKSACWFCPSIQPEELVEFSKTEHGKDYLRAIIRMEENAKGRLTKIDGLWRQGVKGTRGGKAKPGSMAKYIKDNNLLGKRSMSLPVVKNYEFTRPEQVVGVF